MSSSNRNYSPNAIVDYGAIRIPTIYLSRQSRFRYKINLFLIYFQLNWSLLIFYRLKDQFKSIKCQLFHQFYIKKVRLYQKLVKFDRKRQFISKTTTKTMIFDQIRPIFDINRPNLDLIRQFSISMVRISNRNRRDDRSDGWNQIKNSIKTWFEFDLKQI